MRRGHIFAFLAAAIFALAHPRAAINLSDALIIVLIVDI
jgi:hypothetical protein